MIIDPLPVSLYRHEPKYIDWERKVRLSFYTHFSVSEYILIFSNPCNCCASNFLL